ncbi:ADY2 [Malassezia furfur]|nr:ADY2 [Malassezia furfur]
MTSPGEQSLSRSTSREEHQTSIGAVRIGYGPLAHTSPEERANMLPPFGGEMQPGLYKDVEKRKFANPAPLGLSAFALTTFVLSLINLGTLGLSNSSIVIPLGFAYGGLLQLIAGMWEMAIGNTFGATALSSYGGFWISFAILLTPGGFCIEETLTATEGTRGLLDTIGLFLFGWFVLTTVLLLCTLKSTVSFCLLFILMDWTFLLLAIGYIRNDGQAPHTGCVRAGGAFGILSAFLAWYNAYAGIANETNSFLVFPVLYFPWTELGRKQWFPEKNDSIA